MLDRTGNERRTVEQAISAYQATLTQLDEPATDAMLDIYSRLRDSVRGAATDDPDSLGTLNDRLRAIFQEFRLDKVSDDVVGILPILRGDVVERYGSDKTVLVSDDQAVPFEEPTSPAAPVALFASAAEPIVPPAKALKAPLTETGNPSQERWLDGVPAMRAGGRRTSGGQKSQYSFRFSTRQPCASALRRTFRRSLARDSG